MGAGTHGSTTKAGKTRNYVNRARGNSRVEHHNKKHRSPRQRQRHNYRVRVEIPNLIAMGVIRPNPKLKQKKRRF